jgi:hypothetical protein
MTSIFYTFTGAEGSAEIIPLTFISQDVAW